MAAFHRLPRRLSAVFCRLPSGVSVIAGLVRRYLYTSMRETPEVGYLPVTYHGSLSHMQVKIICAVWALPVALGVSVLMGARTPVSRHNLFETPEVGDWPVSDYQTLFQPPAEAISAVRPFSAASAGSVAWRMDAGVRGASYN
jgi:hypothetical protein